ncbi:methionine--tRNA ligase [Catellatospora tritici]|uniref:methionine--tRNA ligase n=1 Tax=Catellatospora tritici TaxID=2851566 RepID=UPI001C2DEB43|nr:methionine--tRNA ligase [Catellatospora tritici]MBV1850006.1 methionine--tRNA ligase [Catellatospora tritici]
MGDVVHYLAAVAWPYANGPRHIGHVSGFGIPSDVFCRYMRMAGHEVLMVSGTDEHGTPILVEAEKEGLTPRELADRYNQLIAEDLVALGLSYDLFTRTTTRSHYAVAQELFRTVHRNGYMIEQTTRGAISPSSGRTLPDRYVEGTCPLCGYDAARGDQCDGCGNQLDAIDLINPRSRVNGEVPKFVETEHFFLDLPALSDALGEWLKSRKDWRPNVLKFSLNLLDDVRPRAMTRDIDWGIPVPLPGWEDNPSKRLYVWFDAVVGYLSASIEWARRFGDTPDAWKRWWSADAEARSYYFMGKDNITFHSQIWPAELLGYNGEGTKGGAPGEFGRLALPTEVVSSEYLTMEGKKFSSSRRVVIYVRDFLSRYDADALRYFVAVAGPETSDTDFTWAEFVRRNNDELVAGWGNLVNRSVSMAAKHFGMVPPQGELTAADRELLTTAADAFVSVGRLIEHHRVKAAITQAMRVVADANRYLSDQAPWKLTDDLARMGTVLHVALQVVSDCNTLLTPFLPHSAQKIHELLGGVGVHAPMPRLEAVSDLDDGRSYPIITGDYAVGARWQTVPIETGRELKAPAPVFRKLDPQIIDEELARLAT